jgi:hypothetical protein
MSNVVIAMNARPEKSIGGQGIIDWYTKYGYLNDFLEIYATEGKMTYNKTTRLYEIHFTPNEFWPKTLESQAEAADTCLGNPDDDGNYPIDGYTVEANIRFIDGQPI